RGFGETEAEEITKRPIALAVHVTPRRGWSFRRIDGTDQAGRCRDLFNVFGSVPEEIMGDSRAAVDRAGHLEREQNVADAASGEQRRGWVRRQTVEFEVESGGAVIAAAFHPEEERLVVVGEVRLRDVVLGRANRARPDVPGAEII